MNLEALAKRLQASGAGQYGKDIFIYSMPSKATQGILLRDRLQGDAIDPELGGLLRGGLQLIARAKTHAVAEQLARKAMAALDVIELTIENMSVKYLRPLRDPVIFPVSEGALIEALVVFEASYCYRA